MPIWLEDRFIREKCMILLTKINNAPIAVNSDLIEYIEETPDTVLTLTNNDRVVVQERMDEIIDKIVHFRRQVTGLVEGEYKRRLRGA
jgi:flagellar protein FlbD